jgi:hypothetical protein
MSFMAFPRWSNLPIVAALRLVRHSFARRRAPPAPHEPTVRDALLKIAAMELAILAATGPLSPTSRIAGGGRGSFASLGSAWVTRMQTESPLIHRAADILASAFCPALDRHGRVENAWVLEHTWPNDDELFLGTEGACWLKESEAIGSVQGRWQTVSRLLASVGPKLKWPHQAGREALDFLQTAAASLNALEVRLQV